MRLGVKNVEDLVRKHFIETPSHTLGHLGRVARGASWFVRTLGGSEKEVELAYIAGWLHDLYRPATDKVDHIGKTVHDAEEILDELGIRGEDAKLIILAVRDHRRPVEWLNLVHQSVYLADKLLEQMGAYAVFRRCLYVGESKDFESIPFKEAIILYFERRLKLLADSRFPKAVLRMAGERNKPPLEFFEAFKMDEEWAVKLASYAYNCGRQGVFIEDCIRSFPAKEGNGRRFRKEALFYLKGNFAKFKELTDGDEK